MAKKENLFFLIQSLTKTEKRYFTTFCFTQNLSKNYLKLYEAISKQEQYDEAAIRKRFKGAAFLKQLHVTKNYLYQLILKSLRNFHTKISKEAEIRDIFRNVEILFSKELYDHCYYEIARAEKVATSYEMVIALIEIQKWKRKLSMAVNSNHRKSVNEILEEEKQCIQKLQHINEYWFLTNNIFDFANDKNQNLLKLSIIKDPDSASTLMSNTLRQHVLYAYHVMNEQPEKAYTYLESLATELEKHPKRITNAPSAYVTVLNNQIGFLIRTKNYKAVLPLIKKVKAIPDVYKLLSESKFSVKLKLRTYNIELELYRDQRDFEQGILLIREIEKYLKAHEKSIPRQYYLLFWYQFANIYFMSGNLPASLQFVNQIINEHFEGQRTDLEKYARFLNLMIHFELDNIIVLKYAVEACRRFMHRVKKTAAYEKVLFRFFSKICNARRDEYKSLFDQLYSELFDEENPLVNDHILDYLDFRSWIRKNSNA